MTTRKLTGAEKEALDHAVDPIYRILWLEIRLSLDRLLVK